MQFTSKFNIGDMVQFANDKSQKGEITLVSFGAKQRIQYSIKMSNGRYLVSIDEGGLEKAEDPPFMFAGHKVTQGNDKSKVQIGCKTVTKFDVENLLDLAAKFDIFDMTLSTYKDDEIRIDQMKELYDNFFQNNTQQKSLESFLAQKNMLGKFISNIHTHGKYSSIKDLTEKVSKHLFIQSAFGWMNSEEGFAFWSKINRQWQNYIKENN